MIAYVISTSEIFQELVVQTSKKSHDVDAATTSALTDLQLQFGTRGSTDVPDSFLQVDLPHVCKHSNFGAFLFRDCQTHFALPLTSSLSAFETFLILGNLTMERKAFLRPLHCHALCSPLSLISVSKGSRQIFRGSRCRYRFPSPQLLVHNLHQSIRFVHTGNCPIYQAHTELLRTRKSISRLL